MNPFYFDVALRADARCEYCRAPELVFNFAFDVEHIFPRSAGGGDSLDNLALTCESCNLHKSVITSRWDDAGSNTVPLFHPGRDSWDLHFLCDPDTCEIRGTTAIGRVTVVQLRMNSNFQIRARTQWMRLGLYP